ncbi:unnamed protein product [Nyctereutes procyonoides]|uniref:(raccoon dog) hypothetical protein n=1 Tax=Nyctereutes procyonoides TaxID=34880 RepID=A0A811YT24_NYCPR|nr:unnamed protein product [Nyctereutes procyonoides]
MQGSRCGTRSQVSRIMPQAEGDAKPLSHPGCPDIYHYQWALHIHMFKESGAKHKGLIEMPNLSEENEVDDTEVNVSKKKGNGDILKDLMKTLQAGTSKVREALGVYLKALKTEFTMGMILPTKAMATQDSTVKRKLRENTLQLVQQFSISPAVLEAEKGGKFQIFDGNITGEYIELRCGNWPEGQTELQLDCKGVPVCKEDCMKFCWQKQHFQEIKGLLQLTTLNG